MVRLCTIAATSLGLLSSAGGCSDGARGLGWRIEVEEPARSDVVMAVTRILDGGCTGDRALYEAELWIDGSRTPPEPPRLPAGTYGFEAEARDAACTVVAVGCVELTLPVQAGATVRVQLTSLDPPRAACAGAACERGGCVAITDGGPSEAARPSDAGLDAEARADGGPADGGSDGCSPPVCCEGEGEGGGMGGVGSCDNGIDDDCDGLADCRDPDCDGAVCAPDMACRELECRNINP